MIVFPTGALSIPDPFSSESDAPSNAPRLSSPPGVIAEAYVALHCSHVRCCSGRIPASQSPILRRALLLSCIIIATGRCPANHEQPSCLRNSKEFVLVSLISCLIRTLSYQLKFSSCSCESAVSLCESHYANLIMRTSL